MQGIEPSRNRQESCVKPRHHWLFGLSRWDCSTGYERPEAEHNSHIYTADGWFFDDGNGFGEGTWADAIDPDGWWMQHREETVDTLVNAMWDLCNGDVRVLLKRLDEYDGGLRHYTHEYIQGCTNEGSLFKDQWKWPT